MEWLFSSLRPLRDDEILWEYIGKKVYHGEKLLKIWMCWLHVCSSSSYYYSFSTYMQHKFLRESSTAAFRSHFLPHNTLSYVLVCVFY